MAKFFGSPCLLITTLYSVTKKLSNKIYTWGEGIPHLVFPKYKSYDAFPNFYLEQIEIIFVDFNTAHLRH